MILSPSVVHASAEFDRRAALPVGRSKISGAFSSQIVHKALDAHVFGLFRIRMAAVLDCAFQRALAA